MSKIKNSKTRLESVGHQLSSSTFEMLDSISQITAYVRNVHTEMEKQAGSVAETAGTVNEITSNIQSLERMIQSQSTEVTQASAAVEEMLANIRSVTDSMYKMMEVFNVLSREIQIGTEKQEDVNQRIKEIELQSTMLHEGQFHYTHENRV